MSATEIDGGEKGVNVLEEDTVRVLNSSGVTAFSVTYDPLTGAWGNSKRIPTGINETVLELTKAD